MRIRIFAILVLLCFIILLFGLSYTQLFRYNLYKKLSEKNRIRLIPLEAPRGKIYDRNGKLIVSNRIAFDVEIISKEVEDEENVIRVLGNILGVERKALVQKINEIKRINPYVPLKVAEDIEKEKAIQLEEARFDLPGVIVTTRPLRDYIYGGVLSHVTGYLGEISETELSRYRAYGYRMRDFVGKDGVERRYNDYLKGKDGGIQMEVDSRGRQKRVIAIKEPERGKNLYLTIDLGLQKLCDSILGDNRGAILAMDPNTGAILALASHPDFDPNIFVAADNTKEVSRLLNDKKGFPMIDRAISASYPPGSVFKIVISIGALESGVFNEKKSLSCGGNFLVGNRFFHCWKEEGHGPQNITEGIKNSCNVFFYQLGLILGAENISDYSFLLGLGKPTGIDLPNETSGFVPTSAWKKRTNKGGWFKGETANYAIGQGYLLTTPIQILCLVSGVATGGVLVEPFLVDMIEDVKTRHRRFEDTNLSEYALDIVKIGLRNVVNETGGTGQYARSEEIIIAGKTGTAQNPNGSPHAWFAGFAPYDKPKIAVVVFVEHGGKGGLKSAHLAKKIIEEANKLALL